MNQPIKCMKTFLFLTLLGIGVSACTAPAANLGAFGKVQKLQQVACAHGERPGRG